MSERKNWDHMLTITQPPGGTWVEVAGEGRLVHGGSRGEVLCRLSEMLGLRRYRYSDVYDEGGEPKVGGFFLNVDGDTAIELLEMFEEMVKLVVNMKR